MKKTRYNFEIFYRVQTVMEKQTIMGSDKDCWSDEDMICFDDTVNNKMIRVSKKDILRIDTTKVVEK